MFDEIDRCLRLLDSAIWLVTAQHRGQRSGLIATSVMSASIAVDHPRLVVGLSKQHFTRELVTKSQALVLHLLAEHDIDWVWRFGMQTGRAVDKLADLETRTGVTGAPILSAASAWVEGRCEASLDIGDRDLFVIRIDAGHCPEAIAPLTFADAWRQATPSQQELLRSQRAADAAMAGLRIDHWRHTRAAETEGQR